MSNGSIPKWPDEIRYSGLNIHQYSEEEMQARLGKEFKLIICEDFIFINPFGQERPYIYALFQRVNYQ